MRNAQRPVTRTDRPGRVAPPQNSERLLRVVHLDHSHEPGGAELALTRIVAAGGQMWQAHVLVPRVAKGERSVFDVLSSTGVQVREVGPVQVPGASAVGAVGAVGFALGMVRNAWATRREVAFREADVVHANTSRTGAYGALSLVARRTPFVVHLRDIVDQRSLGRWGHLIFTRIVLRRADGIIANSEATLASAVGLLRTGASSVVIPSAIGHIRAEARRPDGVFRVGMVARIDPWKGQTDLIRAFATSLGDQPAELVLAGGTAFGHAEHLEELRGLARQLGIERQVQFVGHRDDITAVLSTLDVCVQASTRPEPLGQNVLQYLAAGRATIAVDAGGPAQWITHDRNGLLFPLNDVESLGRHLRALYDDPARRERLASEASRTPGLPTDEAVTRLHYEFFVDVHARVHAIGLRELSPHPTHEVFL